MDGFNAVFSTTFEVDEKKYGTDYHKRFTEYMKIVEENDWVVDAV